MNDKSNWNQKLQVGKLTSCDKVNQSTLVSIIFNEESKPFHFLRYATAEGRVETYCHRLNMHPLLGGFRIRKDGWINFTMRSNPAKMYSVDHREILGLDYPKPGYDAKSIVGDLDKLIQLLDEMDRIQFLLDNIRINEVLQSPNETLDLLDAMRCPQIISRLRGLHMVRTRFKNAPAIRRRFITLMKKIGLVVHVPGNKNTLSLVPGLKLADFNNHSHFSV